ncbi:MAG TPA: DUF92 domain-containing protein [Halobacteriales archaeon]|uniref:DUF92 domain-containing protein n=1 Tax=Candidatus Hikarchaeum yamanae TaxID=2675326 RepID=UPI00181A6013|nr:DUF92 domain-containing protein [Halobacteriales archaeon]
MQDRVEKEWLFALLAVLVLVGSIIEEIIVIIVPLSLIVIIVNFIPRRGGVFRFVGKEKGSRRIVEFSMGLILLTLLVTFAGMPMNIFVVSSILVGGVYIIEKVMLVRDISPIREVAGFVIGAWFLGAFGQVLSMVNGIQIGTSRVVFFAVIGGLLVALAREDWIGKNRTASMLSIALVLWILSLPAFEYLDIIPQQLMFGIGIAGGLGYISWRVGSASITGMLTGIIFSLIVIVFGGFTWFSIMLVFFGVGSLVARLNYKEKLQMGVAEENEGAREAKNVFANTVIAAICVVGFSMNTQLGISGNIFIFGFAGAIAAAMSDTLSSEIGILFENTRLITTFSKVEVGTDGGVTVQGSLAGFVGAFSIGLLTSWTLGVGLGGAIVIGIAGVTGMVGDSVLGASLEGEWMSNEGVNFMATLIGAIASIGGAILGGIVLL